MKTQQNRRMANHIIDSSSTINREKQCKQAHSNRFFKNIRAVQIIGASLWLAFRVSHSRERDRFVFSFFFRTCVVCT